jgi:type 1 glutamine amidotransferase
MSTHGMTRRTWLCGTLGAVGASASAAAQAPGSAKRLVFVAGKKSHAFGAHAHNTGCLYMAQCFRERVPGVTTEVVQDGWPADPRVFDNASTIVVFMDGGGKHPMLGHFDELEPHMRRGCGLAVLHYALTVPKGEPGNRLLDWIGGYYEEWWSVNPMWTAHVKSLPSHPVTRGVKPFSIREEWYYHMRFRENMQGVTPILSAVPPEATRERPFGPHSGNEAVRARKGMPEILAWVYERPGGGRGFGFTGGHFHWSFAQDDYRNVLLNGIAWSAGIEVPAQGIQPNRPTWEQLMRNQEGEMPADFDEQKAMEAIRPRDS